MSEQQKWEREAGIFQSFLDVEPNFAGHAVKCWNHLRDSARDIICADTAGRRIGVEMTEWLDEAQTREHSRWESILRQVKALPDWTVEVYMDPSRACDESDRRSFIEELSGLISGAPSTAELHCSIVTSFRLCGVQFAEKAPTVAKYCHTVTGVFRGSGRVVLRAVGSFSQHDSEEALRRAIRKKVENRSYLTLKRERGLEALFLLVYYDRAIIKNTPIWGVDIKSIGSLTMAASPGAFDGGFVFTFPSRQAGTCRKAYKIFPN